MNEAARTEGSRGNAVKLAESEALEGKWEVFRAYYVGTGLGTGPEPQPERELRRLQEALRPEQDGMTALVAASVFDNVKGDHLIGV